MKKFPTTRTVQEWHGDDKFAFILEVDLKDLKYPEHLHDLHSDYPRRKHVRERLLLIRASEGTS